MTFTSILAFSARGVRSKQLTRRAFWADPTIHYFSQVAVESREGSEELTIAQAHCLGGPDNSLLGPGRLHLAILLLLLIIARASVS